MGEIAEMMLDGTLCEACGEFIGGGQGFPGYCSAQCARDRGMTYTPPSRRQRREWEKHPVDRGERVEFKPSSSHQTKHKPWVCQDCARRFRLEVGARDHWRQQHADGVPA